MNRQTSLHLKTGLLATALLLAPGLTAAGAVQSPRLILQITVDALRGDLPGRYAHLYGNGGFRYLMEQGVHYTNAHYQHANTETIVGHVSLATGTVPAAHGMVGNVWFDREKGRLAYNIEDPDHHLLTAGADVDRKTEIDPTQKAAKVDGRSPATILSSTFSDELAVHYWGRSKIFGVSVQDRGAVSLAGHAGKAFWFSKASATCYSLIETAKANALEPYASTCSTCYSTSRLPIRSRRLKRCCRGTCPARLSKRADARSLTIFSRRTGVTS